MFHFIKLPVSFFIKMIEEKGAIFHKNKIVLSKEKQGFPRVSDMVFTGFILLDNVEVPAEVVTSEYVGISIKDGKIITLFYKDTINEKMKTFVLDENAKTEKIEEKEGIKIGLRDLRKKLKSKLTGDTK